MSGVSMLAAAAAPETGFLEPATLNFIWYVLLSVLLLGYAILDGFDLGVGINHLFVARSDHDRRVVVNSIGPIWDGNEVWLVTFGGALFAAFPVAYATLFSGFYIAFMLLLLALIMRAVCIEFRSKVEHAAWRRIFDLGFAFGSFLIALLLGIAAGNCLLGMPLGEDLIVRQSVLDQLNPFSLLTGLMTVALFALHGSLFLKLRTEGPLLASVERWAWRWWWAFLILVVAVSVWAVLGIPAATENLREWPVLWIVPVLNGLAIANLPRTIHHGRPGFAFLSSCCVIAAFAAMFAMALFPNLIRSSLDESWNLTLEAAASSASTHRIMLVVAGIGLPFVLAYSAVVYWIFWGRVRLDRSSY